jgi:acyl carrier protein
MTATTIDTIKQTLKKDVLFDGLELEQLGIAFEDITDEVGIVGDEGLALDSVDALEIVMLLSRHFGIEVPQPNNVFFEEHLSSFDRLLAFVQSNLQQKAA